MPKVRFRHWNDQIRPGDRPESIAGAGLYQRISAVRYYLRLASERPYEDVRYVHRLRTWSRRSTVALQFFHDVLPHKQTAKLAKQLKKIRKATGDARDCDVLIKKYDAINGHKNIKHVLNFLQEQRELSQEPIERIYSKLGKGKKLSRHLDQLKHHLQSHAYSSAQEDEGNFERNIKLQLHRYVKKYFDATPTNTYDIEGLHNFRIHGKKVRYAMEFSAFAFPQKLKNKIYPEIEKLQAKLGHINDFAMLTRRLQYWIMTTAKAELLADFEQYYKHEDAQLLIELDNFNSKWRLEDLKSQQMEFENLLQDIKHRAVA